MLHPLIELVGDGVIEGRGLVTRGLIRAGEVVSRLEPDQPMIPIADVLAMTPDEQEHLLHYAYECSATHVVNEQGDERYMNHSCDPNTWWSDNDTMVARRDIQPGEEVTYDYATTETTIPYTMTCRCGSENCRGTITNLDYQDAAWQQMYGDHLPAHTLQAIQQLPK